LLLVRRLNELKVFIRKTVVGKEGEEFRVEFKVGLVLVHELVDAV
jgi:hypothetical protein